MPGGKARRAWRIGSGALLVAAAVAFAPDPAQADDLPAVSGLNGKVDLSGASLDGEDFNAASGSVAVPVGRAFGLQADGMVGDYSAVNVWAVGGHAFWRDPGLGLAGLVGSVTDVGTTKIYRYGIEGEYYLDRVTIAGTAGYQSGDSLHAGWGGLDLRYYPADNLLLEAGAGAISNERTGHVGAEWQAPFGLSTGFSLFADAAMGTSDYEHVIGGIRIYFGGGDKPLLRRHREDDPINLLVGGLTSAVSGAVSSTSTKADTNGGASVGGSGCSAPLGFAERDT
ncbi:MAG: hypothetical protein EPN20_03780 [Magnetospirillum sp.]|nr:MAG: hypothetical protein EPN20_03780 [Magnetospirillum sp.]